MAETVGTAPSPDLPHGRSSGQTTPEGTEGHGKARPPARDGWSERTAGTHCWQPSAGTYQDTRDHLSLPMLDVAEQIASFDWELMPIRDLLRKMSSAMTDEVETLADLGNAA